VVLAPHSRLRAGALDPDIWQDKDSPVPNELSVPGQSLGADNPGNSAGETASQEIGVR
jgi:hypothetical protein